MSVFGSHSLIFFLSDRHDECNVHAGVAIQSYKKVGRTVFSVSNSTVTIFRNCVRKLSDFDDDGIVALQAHVEDNWRKVRLVIKVRRTVLVSTYFF